MPSSFRTFNHTNNTTHNCHSHTIHFTTSISESKLTINLFFKLSLNGEPGKIKMTDCWKMRERVRSCEKLHKWLRGPASLGLSRCHGQILCTLHCFPSLDFSGSSQLRSGTRWDAGIAAGLHFTASKSAGPEKFRGGASIRKKEK